MSERRLGRGNRQGSAFGGIGVAKRLNAMERIAPLTGTHLLDIGCANGAYTMRLANRFERVDAIDVEPDRLEDFRASVADMPPPLGEITIRQMDAAHTDYEDETFDVVTAIEVMEHVSELDGTIREMHRVLRPGGRFFITTPNRWFPFETHGVLIRGRRVSPVKAPFVTWIEPLHRRVADARTFTRPGLLDPLRRRGFRVIGASYIFPPFDRSRFGQRIRPITDSMEHSPLRVLGMAHIVCAAKR